MNEMKVFVPSRGFLFFYRCKAVDRRCAASRFRPLTGISLFLLSLFCTSCFLCSVFVPSRGFLFFYWLHGICSVVKQVFSSPHGDFSFSMLGVVAFPFKIRFRPLTGISLFLCTSIDVPEEDLVFVPSRGFLFFYRFRLLCIYLNTVFVPSRGFLFFYQRPDGDRRSDDGFSSPHGDFSFSINISFFLHLF